MTEGLKQKKTQNSYKWHIGHLFFCVWLFSPNVFFLRFLQVVTCITGSFFLITKLTHWKRLWCWEGLGEGGEGDDRGWDGWMASLTRWTWVSVNSGSWWWTGRPGVAKSWTRLSDWSDLIWSDSFYEYYQNLCIHLFHLNFYQACFDWKTNSGLVRVFFSPRFVCF